MLADLTIPPWMWWTAGGLAGLAITVSAISWFRSRTRHDPIEAPFQFDSGSGPRSIGMPTKALADAKPFMPPPAPLAGSATPAGGEQRSAFRRVGNAVLIQIVDKEGRDKPRQAWVVDRSRRGLRIAVENELTIGSLHSVRPMSAPPSAPWTDVEIRHCELADGYWEAGCRFCQPPPMTILMLFG